VTGPMTSFFLSRPVWGPAGGRRLVGPLVRAALAGRSGSGPGEDVESLRAQLEAARTELARRDSHLDALLETVDVGSSRAGRTGPTGPATGPDVRSWASMP
jgi:hypothetical protein